MPTCTSPPCRECSHWPRPLPQHSPHNRGPMDALKAAAKGQALKVVKKAAKKRSRTPRLVKK